MISLWKSFIVVEVFAQYYNKNIIMTMDTHLLFLGPDSRTHTDIGYTMLPKTLALRFQLKWNIMIKKDLLFVVSIRNSYSED